MNSTALHKRGKLLLDNYFREKDDKLLAELRNEMEAEQLASECRFVDKEVLEKLTAMGITSETLCAVVVGPLIAIAWADKKMEPAEREAVLQAVEEHGIRPGTSAYRLISSWLDQRPPEQLFTTYQEYVSALLERMDRQDAVQLREQLIEQGRRVAKATGGLLGYGKISPGEKRVLNALREL